jgi:hypothetical protein
MPRFIIVNDGTIRESRDHEDFRPRKRQRVEQGDDSDKDSVVDYPASSKPELLVPDAEYYLNDDPEADCFVQVENVLFKVNFALMYIFLMKFCCLPSGCIDPSTCIGDVRNCNVEAGSSSRGRTNQPRKTF